MFLIEQKKYLYSKVLKIVLDKRGLSKFFNLHFHGWKIVYFLFTCLAPRIVPKWIRGTEKTNLLEIRFIQKSILLEMKLLFQILYLQISDRKRALNVPRDSRRWSNLGPDLLFCCSFCWNWPWMGLSLREKLSLPG